MIKAAEHIVIIIDTNIPISPKNPQAYPMQYALTHQVSLANNALFETPIIRDLISILSKTNREMNG